MHNFSKANTIKISVLGKIKRFPLFKHLYILYPLILTVLILSAITYFVTSKNLIQSIHTQERIQTTGKKPQHIYQPNLTHSNILLHDRVHNLQRGVDLSLWFRFATVETPDYFTNYIDDTDLNFLTNNGFTHVRLSIAPQYIYSDSSNTKVNSSMLPYIDNAINKILAHKLSVIVDLHDEYMTFEPAQAQQNLVTFWQNFSNHLSTFDPNHVYFELLNEPVFDGKQDQWLQLQNTLIQTVRKQAPQHTIIATGANWGGVDGLLNVTPANDSNVIYSFHEYEPMAFTHQSADWGDDSYPSIKGLAYPYDKTNCNQVLSNVTTSNARSTVQDYCNAQWNKDTLRTYVQRVVTWSQKNNVPLYAGEFGVYCLTTPKDSKLQWLRDLKSIFDANNIGWDLWAYDDCFGLNAIKQNNTLSYDQDVLSIFSTTSNTQSTPKIVSQNIANWKNYVGAKWQWQLSGNIINTQVKADLFDLDYEESSINLINTLHQKGIKAICYINAGAWENWRGDAYLYSKDTIGKDYVGWEGEKWLDIRKINEIGSILEKRMDICKQKGFDAIEPDNIDGYQNDTGFSLTYQDQITFNTWLSDQAHQRGLLIALKNDSEQVNDLLSSYDFAITEDCFANNWCSEVVPFISHGKPVLDAEYTQDTTAIETYCQKSKEMQISIIFKQRQLDASLIQCN